MTTALLRSERILAHDLGQEEASAAIERVRKFVADPPLRPIMRLGADTFARMLESEHPQVTALMLAALPEALRRQVLIQLPTALELEVRVSALELRTL